MKILKFGGSSVGNSQRINNVISILKNYVKRGEKFSVVFSAFQGVTDKLIEIANLAHKHDIKYADELNKLRANHIFVAEELNGGKNYGKTASKIMELFIELEEILNGVYLIRELTPRSLDYVMSFGERLSCTIITETLKRRGVKCNFLNASNLIRTDSNFGNARVNFKLTNKNITEYFKNTVGIQIVTGFIASTEDNEITTLGRGGSDYTASIFGAALDVNEIEIWTDVNGILTADPRKVENAFPLKAVTYEEAMELSHFGAKVIHPPTMLPALQKKIRLRIKNTFNPEHKGTVIIEREKSIAFNVKGISSIEEISLVRVQGGGMVGVTGIAGRLFTSLAEKGINIILITQASSEHSICFAVSPNYGSAAKKAIEEEFKLEMLEGRIGKVIVENELSIIAVVGEDMKRTPGISGKVFQALGKNGINIIAIAQGSSELNISLVIEKASLTKAVNVLHDALFISKYKTTNLFIVGPGLVGGELLKLIGVRSELMRTEHQTNLKVIALADSKKLLFNPSGLEINDWENSLKKSSNASDVKAFILKMKNMNLPNSIFVDCTAGDKYVNYYVDILKSSVSIVTPNKIANTRSYEEFVILRDTAKNHNVQFRFGTNVGAALPVISNLRDLVNNGDEIIKIEAVLSGTLSFIFNSLKPGRKFSESVKEAKMMGYTEPDPRDDLSGLDVARKLLILIRESRIPFEMNRIKIENLVPKPLRKKGIDLLSFLDKYDNEFEERVNASDKKGCKLCYIAKYHRGNATVKVEEINSSHPFYNLTETDNVVSFTTKNYSKKPFVIRGPGAGAYNTAFGIFVDIMRISNYLG